VYSSKKGLDGVAAVETGVLNICMYEYMWHVVRRVVDRGTREDVQRR
jgi:hypothetical protein